MIKGLFRWSIKSLLTQPWRMIIVFRPYRVCYVCWRSQLLRNDQRRVFCFTESYLTSFWFHEIKDRSLGAAPILGVWYWPRKNFVILREIYQTALINEILWFGGSPFGYIKDFSLDACMDGQIHARMDRCMHRRESWNDYLD